MDITALLTAILAAIGVKNAGLAALIAGIIGPVVYRILQKLMERINFDPKKLDTPIGRIIIAIVKKLFGELVVELNRTASDKSETNAERIERLKKRFPILNVDITK